MDDEIHPRVAVAISGIRAAIRLLEEAAGNISEVHESSDKKRQSELLGDIIQAIGLAAAGYGVLTGEGPTEVLADTVLPRIGITEFAMYVLVGHDQGLDDAIFEATEGEPLN